MTLEDRYYHVIKKPDSQCVRNDEYTNHLTNHDQILWAGQLFKRHLHRRWEYGGDEQEHITAAAHNNQNSIVNYNHYEFNDDLWKLQWYQHGENDDVLSAVRTLNLVPVYREYNVTGHGVRLCIIDDGIEYQHPDIRQNFDAEISFNLNAGIADVRPRYEDPRNRHGTRCAGEIAMIANNRKCGVGIAYNSKIGGITLLDGATDDVLESTALSYGRHLVDIYAGSWGPLDNGQVVDGPGFLGHQSLHIGATQGRKGRGALYVFAAGNGGLLDDNCSADGYVNSIYSIAVASATQDARWPTYSETCPGIIVTAFSGNTALSATVQILELATLQDTVYAVEVHHCLTDLTVSCEVASSNCTEIRIHYLPKSPCEFKPATGLNFLVSGGVGFEPVTTDIHNKCTVRHSGTSASAPLVAGILALVLEQNEQLTWRDIQHILIWTSEVAPLSSDASNGWLQNAFGLWYCTRFGFGLISPYKIISLAADNWITVPPKFICSVPFNITRQDKTFSDSFTSDVNVDGCFGKVQYLEHVQLNATILYPIRGHLKIQLISASNSESKLLEARANDNNEIGFVSWLFMTLQFWAEKPQGKWTVRIETQTDDKDADETGRIEHLELILHGTHEAPAHYRTHFRMYEPFTLA